MPSRRRREQDAALERRRILCGDEASATTEAAREQEAESDADAIWSPALRGGRWYAMPSIDRPQPLWQALLSPEWWFGCAVVGESFSSAA